MRSVNPIESLLSSLPYARRQGQALAGRGRMTLELGASPACSRRRSSSAASTATCICRHCAPPWRARSRLTTPGRSAITRTLQRPGRHPKFYETRDILGVRAARLMQHWWAKKHEMKSEIHYSISGELLPDELGELLNAVDLASAVTYTPKRLAQIIAGSTAYVTARHSGILVGFGRLLSDGATIAYINDMSVHQEYQRQGIGQRILELLIHAAGDVNSIYLYTNTADSLYLSNGFQPSEKRLYVFRLPAKQ